MTNDFSKLWFYKISLPGFEDLWFTPNSGFQIFEFAQDHNIVYKIKQQLGPVLGIELLDDYSKVYFLLRWGAERY